MSAFAKHKPLWTKSVISSRLDSMPIRHSLKLFVKHKRVRTVRLLTEIAMPPRKRKYRTPVSSIDTLQRRLRKSAVYAHLGAITRSGHDPSRIAAFKGMRRSPYELLTQVYTGARLADMFPSKVDFNPVDDGSKYPWDSDLYGPVDEDGNPFFAPPPAPVLPPPPPPLPGRLAVIAPPLAPLAPPVGDPNIAAILREVQAVRVAYDAAAAGGGGGGGAAPVIDTTALENILQESYARLLDAFNRMEEGITNGYDQVAEALNNIEHTLAVGTVAGGRAAGGDVEEENTDDTTEREHKDDTTHVTPAASRRGRRPPTLTPADRAAVEDLIAENVEPAETEAEANVRAHQMVSQLIDRFGFQEDAESGAALRK
jgi:hypothetical protein